MVTAQAEVGSGLRMRLLETPTTTPEVPVQKICGQTQKAVGVHLFRGTSARPGLLGQMTAHVLRQRTSTGTIVFRSRCGRSGFSPSVVRSARRFAVCRRLRGAGPAQLQRPGKMPYDATSPAPVSNIPYVLSGNSPYSLQQGIPPRALRLSQPVSGAISALGS